MGILRNCSVPFVVTTAVLIAISAITRVSATTLPDHVTAAYRESNTAYVPAFFHAQAHASERTAGPEETPPEKITLPLTEEEEAWLKEHPDIHVGVMDAWPPLNFVDKQGVPQGIGVDYLNALNKRLNGILTVVPLPFRDSVEQVKSNKLDALMDITPKKEREAFFNFTRPYLSIPHVLVGNKEGPAFETENELAGKTVALEQGFYNVRYFQKNHPDVIVKEYDSTSKALGAVARGEADAYAGNRAVVTYLMRKELLVNLTIQGRMEKPPAVLTIGTRKDYPVLAGILDRALADITPEEINAIHHRWIGEYLTMEPKLKLTQAERSWLIQHPVIRVHNEQNWVPFNFNKNGVPKGYSIDYMNLLAQRLGIKTEYVSGPDWAEFLEMIKAKELDVMLNIVNTEDRRSYINFTDDYIRSLVGIYVREDTPAVQSLDGLEGKTVSLPKGFFEAELIRRHYPQITMHLVKDNLEALEAVLLGKADAALGEPAVTNHLILEHSISGLRLSGNVEDSRFDNVLNIGVRKDWPILRDVLQKAKDSISYGEKMSLRNKWLVQPQANKTIQVELTEKEQEWLENNKRLRLGYDTGWPPVEYADEKGRYQGMSAEYMALISDILDISIEASAPRDWQATIDAAKAGEIDILSAVTRTPQREEYLHFTTPYLSFPMVIVTNLDYSYIDKIETLRGKAIAVVNGYASHDFLKNEYPDLPLILVGNVSEGLRLVQKGNADAFLDSLSSISHIMGREGIPGLKITGETSFKFDLCIGVPKDKAVLAGIMQKALDAIPEQKRTEIFYRWVSITYEHGFDYSLLWKGAVPALLVVLILFYWNRKLQTEVGQRKKAQAQLKLDEERLEALLKLSQVKEIREEQLMEYALEECVRLTDSQIGYLHFVNPDQKTLSLFAWSKNTEAYCTAKKNPHFPLEEAGIWADSVREKKPAVHNDYPTHPNRKELPEGHVPLVRHMSVPVFDGDRMVLVAGVGNKPTLYMDSDIRQLTLFMQNMWGIIKEKRVEANLQFTKFTVDRASDAVFWLDHTGRVTYVNEAACKTLGYTKSELTSMLAHDIDPTYSEATWGEFWNDVKAKRSLSLESVHLTRDGRSIPVEIAINYMELGSQEFGVAFVRDITDRKRAEKELRQNMDELEQFNKLAIGREEKMIQLKDEINQLLTGMGHEIKYKIR